MKRGRPTTSAIRQNIVDILFFMKKGYGYDIYKSYIEIFPKPTLRVVYYHLKKGAALGEFKIKEIKQEKGEYSWGANAEKIYYSLGPNAKPSMNQRVKKYFEKKK
ncbi:hypothetical protein JW707_00480 [Candidatus Woesearchaeota archaeon]|nr:hypothetical protein [Candidatus Woesearchaeota archaeon]